MSGSAGDWPSHQAAARPEPGKPQPAQFSKIVHTLNAGRHGQQAAAAWIGKELLRDALNLRARVSGSGHPP